MQIPRILLFVLGTLPLFLHAAQPDYARLQSQIEEWREYVRGPYRDIRWFCEDGSTREARDPCPDGMDGVQRARYSPELIRWGSAYHLFPAQILATTNKTDFWDARYHQSRLKQYQIDQFLRRVDNGWILEKAQYYRGAMQAEDEQEWGQDFLLWLMGQAETVHTHYFLLRQAALTLPHRNDTPQSLEMRALSLELADSYAAFMNLRIKIHGQPGPEDVDAVVAFWNDHHDKLNDKQRETLRKLTEVMKDFYAYDYMAAIKTLAERLPAGSLLRDLTMSYVALFSSEDHSLEAFSAGADLMRDTRDLMTSLPRASARLAAMDIGILLEQLLIRQAADALAAPTSVSDEMEYICYLEQAVYASGFVSEWEWAAYQAGQWEVPSTASMALGQLLHFEAQTRRLLEWSANTGRATYSDEVETYTQLNPAAAGFVDDIVRSSILLPLGRHLERLGNFASQMSNLRNQVAVVDRPGSMRGLNPGYAKGKLVVVPEGKRVEDIDKHKIYVFDHPPADLKPVAGIATVSEGNMVSHVQLLARNLGIPNAVLNAENLADLQKWSGEEVFYAVSPQGTVVLKKAEDMDTRERALFAVESKARQKITVPLDKMDIGRTDIINMRELTAASSGRWCGPKAANLGQLKQLFPENVVEGLVIPFGTFKAHMDQTMPGEKQSYWAYLQQSFAQAAASSSGGQLKDKAEATLLRRLDTLRTALKSIPFLPGFERELESAFVDMLGKPLGEIPVFLRSDTNMEDLPDFTGAGLNLTLFNVRERAKILQGIRDVWASPYTERSFQWRQQYLLNPENVYPSLLIIPGVNVDYSGVVITKGVARGVADEITAAFSWGVGGAVDGQRAETYLIYPQGHLALLSPAREQGYKYLPATGGVEKARALPQRPILNLKNLSDIYRLSAEVEETFPGQTEEEVAAYDIELGFQDDKLWLFQVRPFVENSQATASEYLLTIDPRIDPLKSVDLTQKL